MQPPGGFDLIHDFARARNTMEGLWKHLGHEGLLQREIEKVDATPSRALLVTWPHKGSEN